MTIYLTVGMKYLHGRYLFQKYLLLHVSLSCCIWYKIPAHTLICICLYMSVFLSKIHSHTCRSCSQGCSCFYSKSTRPSGWFIARGLGFRRCSRLLGSRATCSRAPCSRPIVVVIAHHAIEQISLMLLHLSTILFATRFR
jgi:hypothetical protein